MAEALKNHSNHIHVKEKLFKLTDEENKCIEDLRPEAQQTNKFCHCNFWLLAFFMLGCISSQTLRFYKFKLPKPQENETQFFYNFSSLEANTLIDFAAATNGGKIITHLSKEGLSELNRLDMLISDDNSPGMCWGFQGNHAEAAIKLFHEIRPVSFELVYLNSLDYSTAPKEFRVYSLRDNKKEELLGRFHFDLQITQEVRKNSQIFFCRENCDKTVDSVLLEIQENYGNSFTCVYQFKVHGTPV